MARSSTTKPESPSNPDVKFERSDLSPGSILTGGLLLTLGIVFAVGFALVIGTWLFRQEAPRKSEVLPEALVDRKQGLKNLPQPALEAIEDIRDKHPALFPPRAKTYFASQQELLDNGDGKQCRAMSATIKDIAKKLPVRKTGDNKAPTTFTIQLPSKASSGQTHTGGQ